MYFVPYTTTYSTLKQLELPELTLKAMAALAAVKTQGDASSLETFAKLAKNCMTFNAGGQVAEVMESVWNACQSAPTSKDTPFSKVFIHTKVAKEFDAVNLSEWVQALDDEMAVACCLAVKELKVWLKQHGADYLTWDKVVSIFNNCDYIIKDESSSKRINDIQTFDEKRWFDFPGSDLVRKRKILTWFKDLFNKKGEQSVLDNSVIVQEGTLDRLADIASECGAALKDPVSLFFATEQKSDKVMEIGIIRFPRKGDPRIKLFRLVIFAFFKSTRILLSQHDQSGFEVEYDSVEFKPNTAAIDKKFAQKAKEKLAQEDTFDF